MWDHNIYEDENLRKRLITLRAEGTFSYFHHPLEVALISE